MSLNMKVATSLAIMAKFGYIFWFNSSNKISSDYARLFIVNLKLQFGIYAVLRNKLNKLKLNTVVTKYLICTSHLNIRLKFSDT